MKKSDRILAAGETDGLWTVVDPAPAFVWHRGIPSRNRWCDAIDADGTRVQVTHLTALGRIYVETVDQDGLPVGGTTRTVDVEGVDDVETVMVGRGFVPASPRHETDAQRIDREGREAFAALKAAGYGK